jgi:hypothetical protein
MRRGLVLLLVAAGATVTALPAVGAGRSAETLLTVRLISTTASSRTVDTAPKGTLNNGDAIYEKSVLRNAVAQFGKPKGAVVGSDSAVLLVRTQNTALLDVQVKLPGGTLHVRGLVGLVSDPGGVPVVGGTGRFTGARGTCRVEASGGRALNTYRLTIL